MVEVAIKAVEAVFDWRAYQAEVFGYTEKEMAEEVTIMPEEEEEEPSFIGKTDEDL